MFRSHSHGVAARLLGLAALFLLLDTGCGFFKGKSDTTAPDKDKDKPTAKKLATPREAFHQANESLVLGDEAAYFKAVKADDQQRDYFTTMLAMNKSTRDFREAFLKAYGEAAWKRFNDPNIDPGNGEGNSALTVPDFDKETAARLDKMTYEEKGSEAFANGTNPDGKPSRWRFLKVDDGWVVDGATMMPPGGIDVNNVKTVKIITANVKKYQKAIGKPGISADNLDVQLGRAVVRELYGMEPNGRDRFDINAIKD